LAAAGAGSSSLSLDGQLASRLCSRVLCLNVFFFFFSGFAAGRSGGAE
jgi:hypothetical protein